MWTHFHTVSSLKLKIILPILTFHYPLKAYRLSMEGIICKINESQRMIRRYPHIVVFSYGKVSSSLRTVRKFVPYREVEIDTEKKFAEHHEGNDAKTVVVLRIHEMFQQIKVEHHSEKNKECKDDKIFHYLLYFTIRAGFRLRARHLSAAGHKKNANRESRTLSDFAVVTRAAPFIRFNSALVFYHAGAVREGELAVAPNILFSNLSPQLATGRYPGDK